MAAKMQAFPHMNNREGLSIGQVAMQWGKTTAFVRDLIDAGMLTVRDDGAVAVSELARFYKTQGHLLD